MLNILTLNPDGKPDTTQSESEAVTKAVLQSPELSNALVVKAYQSALIGDETVNFTDIVANLQASSEALKGDTPLQEAEQILMAQSQSLNALFCNLATRASSQKNVDNFDKLLRLALKAQNQCRTTLETLSTIKNPPVVFAKQANIAHNQVVNNSQPLPRVAVPQTVSQETPQPAPINICDVVQK